MKRIERVVIALLGMAIAVLPLILRLSVFKEDIGAFDSEFWGAMAMYGLFFGTMLIFCAICGQRLFDEVNDGSDE